MNREHHNAVIDGLRYNTDTATHICNCDNGLSRSNNSWYRADLYRTQRGHFFVAGRGGPYTIFGHLVGNSYTGGSGIRTLEPDNARAWMERAGCGEAAYELAGLELQDA